MANETRCHEVLLFGMRASDEYGDGDRDRDESRDRDTEMKVGTEIEMKVETDEDRDSSGACSACMLWISCGRQQKLGKGANCVQLRVNHYFKRVTVHK